MWALRPEMALWIVRVVFLSIFLSVEFDGFVVGLVVGLVVVLFGVGESIVNGEMPMLFVCVVVMFVCDGSMVCM